MTISMDKKYRTRDGREVRVLMTDGNGAFPVIGAVLYGEQWYQGTWTAGGASFTSNRKNARDLIEVPTSGYASCQEAVEKAAGYEMADLAIVKVTFREGETAAE